MPDENVDIRVRLQGGKIVAAEAKAVATGVDDIGDSADRTTGHLKRLSDTSNSKLRPALSNIGRYLGYAALGMAGFSAGVAAFGTYVGLNFNATLENNTVAFSHFLGSTKKANKYLGELYHLAATTPFEFEGLVGASRQFLSFGYGAKEAKEILEEVGDTAAGLGGGTEQIDRMVMALGQMKAKGRIQTEELLQLAELGVPVFSYLQKGLNLTGEQLQSELQKGQVGFREGLEAIRAGMRKDFGGMSKEQAKTFGGQLSTLHDNIVQGLGQLTKPVFTWLKTDVLPALNAALPGIQKWLKGAIADIPALFDKVKSGFADFLDAVAPAKPFVENVLWPLVKGLGIGLGVTVVAAIKVAVPLFKGFMVVLGAIGTAAKPLRGLFEGFGVAASLATRYLMVLEAALIGKVAPAAKWVANAGHNVWRVFQGIANVAATVYRAAAPVVSVFARIYTWGFKLQVALGVAGVKAFSSFASKGLGALKSGVAGIFGFLSGLGSKFYTVGKGLVTRFADAFKTIGHVVLSAFGSTAGLAGNIGRSIEDWINSNTLFGDHIGIDMGPLGSIGVDIPELATGGVVRSPGAVLVGERGPELLSLNPGARVDPLPRLAAAAAGGGGGDFHFTIPVQIDGKEVGRAVEKYADRKRNRR
jgi:tape measure domain-containing protein